MAAFAMRPTQRGSWIEPGRAAEALDRAGRVTAIHLHMPIQTVPSRRVDRTARPVRAASADRSSPARQRTAPCLVGATERGLSAMARSIAASARARFVSGCSIRTRDDVGLEPPGICRDDPFEQSDTLVRRPARRRLAEVTDEREIVRLLSSQIFEFRDRPVEVAAQKSCVASFSAPQSLDETASPRQSRDRPRRFSGHADGQRELRLVESIESPIRPWRAVAAQAVCPASCEKLFQKVGRF